MSKTGTFGLVDENTPNNNRSTKIVKNEHTILEGFSEEEFSIENIKNTIAHLNPQDREKRWMLGAIESLL